MSAVTSANPAGSDRPDLLLDDLDVVLERLGCDVTGLATPEAARRLEATGPNLLMVASGSGFLRAMLRQLSHPLALLLWLAAALAFSTQGITLGTVIVAVIAVNAAFALLQERHAEHAVAALAEYLPPHAAVVRDGRRTLVSASEVVPGDLLFVEEGRAISADGRLISGAVEVDLSAVTGESVPVLRHAQDEPDGEEPGRRVADAQDVVLSGTTCTSGEATALVVHTGMATELGRIAGLTSRTRREASPLEKQVRRVAWLIAAVAVGVGLAFLPLGMFAGLRFSEAATFAIGLLVANVPEGLLPTITLALAVGVAQLARRGGLVKRLSAVETLGSTDVICTDKTGTLTQNRMQVHSTWSASGRHTVPQEQRGAFAEVLRLCSTADRATRAGDPTELALLAAADRLWPRVTTGAVERVFHFDPRRRLMTVLVHDGATGARRVLTKGAPESVLSRCARVVDEHGLAELSSQSRRRLEVRVVQLAGQGLRLLACAARPVTRPPADRDDAERDLTLLGFVALADPVRDAVPEAVRQAHRAGITVHVITGDNGATGAAIARAAGIGTGGLPCVTGAELEAMDDDELDVILTGPGEVVFARSSPEDKLRIASRLQAAGHVVAMTGDGVNDAPALRRADIGVAMGSSGTDVAREAATMVLTDDDFATIIVAVESGRRVYDNVRKFILYIFAHTVPELVPFLLFALSGGAIPLGLTVVQILMIDLGTETLPALALGREAPEPGLMDRPPRRRDEGIITRRMLFRAWALLGVTSAVLVTGGFLWTLASAGWSPGDATDAGSALHGTWREATTMTFAGIVACQVGTALAARTDRVSLRSVGVLSNRLLLLGILFELVLTAVVIYAPVAQGVFGTEALGWTQVAVLSTFPAVVWAVDEAYRAWGRRREPARTG